MVNGINHTTKTLTCNGEKCEVLYRPLQQKLMRTLTKLQEQMDLPKGEMPDIDFAKLSDGTLTVKELMQMMPQNESDDKKRPSIKEMFGKFGGSKISPMNMIKIVKGDLTVNELVDMLNIEDTYAEYKTWKEDGIIIERDVPMKLRDGVTMYTDIYRPDTEVKVPCIVAWSPYGKDGGGFVTPGVDPNALSPYTKGEGPDPMYWARMGFAVANPDPRGTGNSEGDMFIFGDSESKDGYDFIEWLATLEWCNSRIGMMGNSYLAMSQWYIASEQPPHLCCIAPWEGSSDVYRELIVDGGIPTNGFLNNAFSMLPGKNLCEDIITMGSELPDAQSNYWKSKMAKTENINIPVYACGGYSHFHIMGTLNAFAKVPEGKKWLRLHREFEWPDQYHYEQLEDAKRFFERYLKNIHNGWESTPVVQLEVMDAFDYDYQTRRPENEFPLARTEYKKLYLNSENHTLEDGVVTNNCSVSYDAEHGQTIFDYQFSEDTELTGYMKFHGFVEAAGNDDCDLFLTVQKLNEKKEYIPTNVMGQHHPGAWSKLRISCRKLDEELSKDYLPVQKFHETEKLSKGEVAEFDVAFFPFSRIWHKGEYLRLVIAGHYEREDGWFEPLSWHTNNKGEHIVHSGGEYGSFLQIPVVPARNMSSEYIYR